ncbi:unnamed protein product [Peniophora sp. CBMAI 1063]|nr:unnamed protein product [Peniophora sp. CBMAI 1063]
MANGFFDRARLEFLYEWLAQYRFAQDHGTLSEFWERMITAYLVLFPDDDQPEEVFERARTKSGRKSMKRPEGVPKPIRERLREWFRNSRRHDRSGTATTSQTSTTVKLLVRANKKLPEWQYYSSLYFHQSVEPTMGTYEDYKAGVPEGEKVLHPLPWRMQCIRDSYDAAPDNVKENVRRFKTLSETSIEELSGDPGDLARVLGVRDHSSAVAGASAAPSHVTATSAGTGGDGEGEAAAASAHEQRLEEEAIISVANKELEEAIVKVREAKLAERDKAIGGLRNALAKVIHGIVWQTGWSVSVFAGGPRPSANGSIEVLHLHGGPSTDLTFLRSKVKFVEDSVLSEFNDFLDTAYPADSRLTLPSADDVVGTAIVGTPDVRRAAATRITGRATRHVPATRVSTALTPNVSETVVSSTDAPEPAAIATSNRARTRRQKRKGKARATSEDLEADTSSSGEEGDSEEMDYDSMDPNPADDDESDDEMDVDGDPQLRSISAITIPRREREIFGLRNKRRLSDASVAGNDQSAKRIGVDLDDDAELADPVPSNRLSRPRPRPRRVTRTMSTTLNELSSDCDSMPALEGLTDVDMETDEDGYMSAPGPAPTDVSDYESVPELESYQDIPPSMRLIEGDPSVAYDCEAARKSPTPASRPLNNPASLFAALTRAMTESAAKNEQETIEKARADKAAARKAARAMRKQQAGITSTATELVTPGTSANNARADGGNERDADSDFVLVDTPPSAVPESPGRTAGETVEVLFGNAQTAGRQEESGSVDNVEDGGAEGGVGERAEGGVVEDEGVEGQEQGGEAGQLDAAEDIPRLDFDDMDMDNVLAILAECDVPPRQHDFIVAAIAVLERASEHPDWQLALRRWILLEIQLQFPAAHDPNHKLTTDDRPDSVRWWLARGRKYGRPPIISDLVEYGEDMRLWYTHVMPEWRRGAQDWPLLRVVPNDADWQTAYKGGANGMFIVLIACYWWISQAKSNDKALRESLSVVEDVAWALGQMTSSGSG